MYNNIYTHIEKSMLKDVKIKIVNKYIRNNYARHQNELTRDDLAEKDFKRRNKQIRVIHVNYKIMASEGILCNNIFF